MICLVTYITSISFAKLLVIFNVMRIGSVGDLQNVWQNFGIQMILSFPYLLFYMSLENSGDNFC